MALSRVFDIAGRTLSVYQQALNVTSDNVANAANTNYSRKKVVFATASTQSTANTVWGSGVKIADVQRMRNTLADAQIRTNNQKYYDSSKQSELITQVESAFNETSDSGLSTTISAFFNSWSSLATNPSSSALRSDIVNAATKLSSQVKSIHDDLQNISTSSLTEFSTSVDTLNSDLTQIQQLNKSIFEAKSDGYPTADLEDQRDAILDDVSQIANVTISYDTSGTANVSVGGILAADRESATQFTVSTSGNKLQLVTKDSGTAASLKSGELNAYAEVYNKKIPGYLSSLDTVISNIVNTVNAAHQKGYDNTTTPQTGTNFFDSYEEGVLTINNDIKTNVNKIAVSSDGTSGNGDIATAIADLATKATTNGSTFLESYNKLVSTISTDKTTNDDTSSASNLAIQQMTTVKNSTSAVSTDEEMTNLIEYQRTYQAASKLISASDTMLQSLLAMVQ